MSSKDQGILENFDPELRRAFDFPEGNVPAELIDHAKIKMHKESIKLSGDGAFYTLQGEGPTTGMPCVFLRLHVCNLKCDWCDAWYTWNPNTEEFWTEGKDVPINEVADLIEKTWDGPDQFSKRLILTGGEPLIQRKQLTKLMQLLDKRGGSRLTMGGFEHSWNYEIETNGTLMPTSYMLENCQFNCSPKLSNSHNRIGSMVKHKILYALNEANTTFKFVCMTEDDLNEMARLYSPHIDYDKIIIMPQGITEEEVSANAKRLAEPCKKRGLRLMPRLQAICWDGARRGV